MITWKPNSKTQRVRLGYILSDGTVQTLQRESSFGNYGVDLIKYVLSRILLVKWLIKNYRRINSQGCSSVIWSALKRFWRTGLGSRKVAVGIRHSAFGIRWWLRRWNLDLDWGASRKLQASDIHRPSALLLNQIFLSGYPKMAWLFILCHEDGLTEIKSTRQEDTRLEVPRAFLDETKRNDMIWYDTLLTRIRPGDEGRIRI
jgi:hypothetical protein